MVNKREADKNNHCSGYNNELVQEKLQDLRVPGAKFRALLQVGSRQSGARHEVNVFLRIKAHLLQKWH